MERLSSDLEEILRGNIPNRDRDLSRADEAGMQIEPEIRETYAWQDIHMSHMAMILSVIPEEDIEDCLYKIVEMAGPVVTPSGFVLDEEESVQHLRKPRGKCGYNHYRVLCGLARIIAGPDFENQAMENLIKRKVHTSLVTSAALAALEVRKGIEMTFRGSPDISSTLKKTGQTAKIICPGINAEVHILEKHRFERHRCIMRYWHDPLYAQYETSTDENQHKAALRMTPAFWGLEPGTITTLTSARSISKVLEGEFAALGLSYTLKDGRLFLITPRGDIRIGEEVAITLGQRHNKVLDRAMRIRHASDLFMQHYAPVDEKEFVTAPRGIRITQNIPLTKEYLTDVLGIDFDTRLSDIHERLHWEERTMFSKDVVYGAPHYVFRMDWKHAARKRYAFTTIATAAGALASYGLAKFTGDNTHYFTIPPLAMTVGILLDRLSHSKESTAILAAVLGDTKKGAKKIEDDAQIIERAVIKERATREELQAALRAGRHDLKGLLTGTGGYSELGGYTIELTYTLLTAIEQSHNLEVKQLQEAMLRCADENVNILKRICNGRVTIASNIIETLTEAYALLERAIGPDDPDVISLRERMNKIQGEYQHNLKTVAGDSDELTTKIKELCSKPTDVSSFQNLREKLDDIREYFQNYKKANAQLLSAVMLLDPSGDKYGTPDVKRTIEGILDVRLQNTTLTVDADLPYYVQAPMDIVETFIRNSVINALQSPRTSTISITCKMENGHLLYEVTDDGAGFDKKTGEEIGRFRYTTKGDQGNGEGIWNIKVLSAKYPGSSYAIDSKGVDQGATAMLQVPYKKRMIR